MILVAPSILSANFANLSSDISKVETAGADWLHIDVMDGHFVPNITMGPQVVADLRKNSKLFFDVHLMIERPENMIIPFVEAGADMITVHIEACKHLHRVIQQIKDLGIMAGIALNPATPIHLIEEIIREIDLVLIMTVNPGFGGQKFIKNCISKINKAKSMINSLDKKVYLQVDGGINKETAYDVIKAGADVLVAGSYIFNSNDIGDRVRVLKEVKYA